MKKLLAAFGVATIVLTGCSNSDEKAAVKDTVIASFYPVAEMAQRIGGDGVKVENLTPPGVEPHDLELSPKQVEKVRDAKAVFYVGHGLTPAIEAAVKERSTEAIDVSKGLTLERGEGSEFDPHFWLDPIMMNQATRRVEANLVEAFPEQANDIRRRADEYRKELSALDDEMKKGMASCQLDTIVTSHDAFTYMARHYNFKQESISLSPDAEPDAKQLSRIVDVIKANKVGTVFTETLVSPRVADSVARESGAKVRTLNPIEGLTEEQIAAKATYASIMRENLAALREARICA